MMDTIGLANMSAASPLFVSDRFGVSNSALNLNGNYATLPTGIYFNTPQFSISVWIYPLSIGSWSRLIDFGNGYPSNNVIFTLDQGLNQKPVFEIVQGTTTPTGYPISSIRLVYSQWQLLTCTFDGATQNIYINAVLTASANLSYTMPTISRTNNYIGKSSYSSDGYSFSYIDELQFSNVSLSASQVNNMFLSDGQYKSSALNLYAYLTHYWPVTSTQMLNDIVGCTDMTQGTTPVIYVADRFGNQNSALALNGGFTQVPSGVFFNSPKFSVTVWVYPQSLTSDSTIFTFNNGSLIDEISIKLANAGVNNLYFQFFIGSINQTSLVSPLTIAFSQWQFIAVTYDGSTFKMYTNAVLTASISFNATMPTVTRTSNFFGKSSNGSGLSQSYLDDIRFYNTSLNQSQINDIINANDTSSTINYCTNITTTSTSTSTCKNKIVNINKSSLE